MAVRLIQGSVRLWAVVLALSCCAGCSVFIQNRYAVFGFEGLQTESAEQARVWSLALLGGIAVVSAALGATGSWLGRCWYRGWREGLATAASPPAKSLGGRQVEAAAHEGAT